MENYSVLAVADGVGGWNEVGVDPAKYSRELCQKFFIFFEKNKTKSLK